MYSVDNEDIVLPNENMPQSSIGAPIPIVLSDENRTVVAYYTQEDEIDNENMNEPIAIITFNRCHATILGPPNDEAFSGHPLFKKGLRST
ncbi:hypothetical protein SAMN04487970_10633 [Paenibacillus tianmuensis]|uniref:Uncharacterized protein n=1 Tax=Paenibacillus tianmuensis TaxID=624147 RepID=A0A1G4TR71_9BACL|nr:hypothetical protein [Paenibacillus tianmuensis]SCW83841.1 hypothetical protein SAMN04487970_10633 [Paenibacillus tianmuensis]